MRLYLLISALLFFIQPVVHAQSIYDIAVNDIDGNPISLQSFAGKKILLIVIPFDNLDSTSTKLEQCKSQYNVEIIGIVSVEQGYRQDKKESILNRYGGGSVILSEPMTINKGAGQSPLLRWLTDSSKNRYSSRDPEGVGMKFFISESGRLYATMGPRTALDAPIVKKILATKAD